MDNLSAICGGARPKSLVEEELKGNISKHKPELLALLSQEAQAAMSNNLPNNKIPHSSQNIYTEQQNPKNTTEGVTDVLQDKGVFEKARAASLEPDPLSKQSRARSLGIKMFRSNKRDSRKVKLVHTTLHIHPLVLAELQRLALQNQLSLSKVGAAALEDWGTP